MSHFQPLEVVGRGSDAQLQVGENLNEKFSRTRVNTTNANNNSVGLKSKL